MSFEVAMNRVRSCEIAEMILRACSTWRSVSPNNEALSRPRLSWMAGIPASEAVAFASNVLEQPGTPTNRAPAGLVVLHVTEEIPHDAFADLRGLLRISG